jgi:hypothetical protein
MITPSFGLTATERVLPRLALDWTTGLAQPGVDVTRAGVATFVGSDGLIQSASINTQRIDYSTGTAGLLVEESRTNLLPYSEDFADVSWIKVNATITSNAIIAPDGTLTGDKLVEDTANTFHGVTKSILKPSVNPTITIYAKAAGRDWLYLAPFPSTPNDFTNDARAFFDVANGVVGTVTRGTASITHVGNGWYRCSLTMSQMTSSLSTGLTFQAITAIANGTQSYQGNGTSGVYIWGAQLEAGAFATSYIPTEAVAVTRNADVATMTGTNFSDWYNASEGTFVFQGSVMALVFGARLLGVSDGTNTNRMEFLNNTAEGKLRFFSSGGVASDTLNAMTPNVLFGGVGAYKLNNYAFALNGGAIVSDTLATVPTVNQLRIGYATSAGSLNGHMNKIMYFPQRLTNAEVQSFSKV